MERKTWLRAEPARWAAQPCKKMKALRTYRVCNLLYVAEQPVVFRIWPWSSPEMIERESENNSEVACSQASSSADGLHDF